MINRLRIIDSHTGGEPTRLIVQGGPDLGTGTLPERLRRFRSEFDHIRRAVINEPRGSDVLVGGLLCEPTVPDSAAGVIFFNNTGFLNMCGHGTIGLVVTLAHLGKIRPGKHHIETPVGTVTAELLDANRVAVQNVPSYRLHRQISVLVDGHGPVTGDVAWGGNWFFLVSDHGQELDPANWRSLTDFTLRIRQALQRDNITGANGAEIDHIELFGPPSGPHADSRNFVLCPGAAWDRSPCGTGTSAKLACLYADQRLAPGQIWRQESLVGSVFAGHVQPTAPESSTNDAPVVIPTITGSAWVTAEADLLLDPSDPFRHGIC